MPKYISVPSSWVLYEVPDDVVQLLSSGSLALPPQVVLETMVFNGVAKRIAVIGSMKVNHSDDDEVMTTDDVDDDDDSESPEGKGVWYGADD